MSRRWCPVCKSAGFHSTGCPEDPGEPDPRDMDPVKGAYLDIDPQDYEDDEPKEYDYEAALDAKWAARERQVEAWRLKR